MRPIDDPSTGRARPNRAIVRAGALVAVMVVSVLWFGRSDEPSQRIGGTGGTATGGSPGPTASDSPTEPHIATRRAVNHDGGYTFRYPAGWKVTLLGPVTQVKGPGSKTVVNLSAPRAAPPRRVASGVFGVIEQIPTYERVRKLDMEAQRFAGVNAFLVAGRAVNQNGARIRILVVALDRGRKTFPVTIFTAEGTDPARVLPRVEAIAASIKRTRNG